MISSILPYNIDSKNNAPIFKGSDFVHTTRNCLSRKTSGKGVGESIFFDLFSNFIGTFVDKLLGFRAKTRTFTDGNSKKQASLSMLFPKKDNMYIEYLEVEEHARKRPQQCINTVIEIIRYILSEGKRKSVRDITCLPMDDSQARLYQKFGFKSESNYTMRTSFKDFVQKAGSFLKRHNIQEDRT